MATYLDLNTLNGTSAAVTALGVLVGGVLAVYRFYARQKAQDRELAAVRSELTLLCYGVRACLSGLREQGCNGPVTEALNKLDKHLNPAAHKGEEGV